MSNHAHMCPIEFRNSTRVTEENDSGRFCYKGKVSEKTFAKSKLEKNYGPMKIVEGSSELSRSKRRGFRHGMRH